MVFRVVKVYRQAAVLDGAVDGDLDAAAALTVNRDALLWRRIDPGWWLELDRR